MSNCNSCKGYGFLLNVQSVGHPDGDKERVERCDECGVFGSDKQAEEYYNSLDLLDHEDLLPEDVRDLLANIPDDTYEECVKAIEKLNQIGYTANYYLTATLFDLKKISNEQTT